MKPRCVQCAAAQADDPTAHVVRWGGMWICAEHLKIKGPAQETRFKDLFPNRAARRAAQRARR